MRLRPFSLADAAIAAAAYVSRATLPGATIGPSALISEHANMARGHKGSARSGRWKRVRFRLTAR